MKSSACFVILLYLATSCQGLDQTLKGGPATTVAGITNQKFDASFMPFTSQQLFDSIKQMVTEAVDGLGNTIQDKLKSIEDRLMAVESRMGDSFKSIEDKVLSIENRMEDRISHFQTDLNYRSDSSDTKIEDKLSQLQNILDDKLDALENRLEDKLDNNKLQNVSQLDTKLSKQLEILRNETTTDILNSFDASTQRSNEAQRATLGKFSDNSERTMNRTLDLLSHIENKFDSFKKFGETKLQNQTETFHELRSYWENSTQCLQSRSACYNGMGYVSTKKYQRLEVMRDNILNREILCDTDTNGGGWIVIQRRTEGDVDFYRNWEDYKNGFGTPPGDFWLGNEAIHDLTSTDDYELRIDFKSNDQNLYARYSNFSINGESDNYRLQLGSHSGTLIEEKPRTGFSYSSGYQFSTYDKENNVGKICASRNHGAWWYDNCQYSNLNGMWGEKRYKGVRWYTGSHNFYASSTEMKIRKL